jgi:ferredoxin
VQIHFRLAAVICGLGESGYSKMLLTPQFGPMQRLAFLMTDMPIEPDPLYNGPPLCNKCKACVRACPGHCIDPDETIEVEIGGRKIEWGKLDEWSCFAYYRGAALHTNPFLCENDYAHIEDGENLMRGEKRITPAQFPEINKVIDMSYPSPTIGYAPPKCGGCLRACLASMEHRGLINKHFKQPFREKTKK